MFVSINNVLVNVNDDKKTNREYIKTKGEELRLRIANSRVEQQYIDTDLEVLNLLLEVIAHDFIYAQVETIEERKKNLFNIARTVNLLSDKAPQDEPKKCKEKYTASDGRNIWRDIEFLHKMLISQPEINYNNHVIPDHRVQKILEHDIPILVEIIYNELNVDLSEDKKQEIRALYYNTTKLPYIYEIANYYREKESFQQILDNTDPVFLAQIDPKKSEGKLSILKILEIIVQNALNFTDVTKSFDNYFSQDLFSNMYNYLTLFRYGSKEFLRKLMSQDTNDIFVKILIEDIPFIRIGIENLWYHHQSVKVRAQEDNVIFDQSISDYYSSIKKGVHLSSNLNRKEYEKFWYNNIPINLLKNLQCLKEMLVEKEMQDTLYYIECALEMIKIMEQLFAILSNNTSIILKDTISEELNFLQISKDSEMLPITLRNLIKNNVKYQESIKSILQHQNLTNGSIIPIPLRKNKMTDLDALVTGKPTAITLSKKELSDILRDTDYIKNTSIKYANFLNLSNTIKKQPIYFQAIEYTVNNIINYLDKISLLHHNFLPSNLQLELKAYRDYINHGNLYVDLLASNHIAEFLVRYSSIISNQIQPILQHLEIEDIDINDMILEKKSWWEKASIKEIKAKLIKISELEQQTKQLLNSTIEPQEKLFKLGELIEKPLTDILKGIVYEKSLNVLLPDRLIYLTKIFNELAALYIYKAKIKKDPEYYTDATKFYQYVLSISSKELEKASQNLITIEDKEFYEKQMEHSYNQLNSIKQELVTIISKNTNINEAVLTDVRLESHADMLILSELRKNTEISLKAIDKNLETAEQDLHTIEGKFISESRNLFQDISKELNLFLVKIIKDSEEIIGKPPCNYTVIGLGSLALQQITPYSDFEFAILTENDTYKKSSHLKESNYFVNLSHLIHFRVINFRETIIPASKYGIDLEHLITRGVSLDLGGRTPLGRIDKDKPYELIQTPALMANYLQDKYVHVDKALPYILEACIYLYGNKDLIQKYQDKVTSFLHQVNSEGIKNYEIRAIKRLKEGGVEHNYLNIPNKPLTTPIKGNIELYEPQLIGLENEGRLFNVKQEIYRLADRWLYDLSSYYGIQSKNLWDSIEQLKARKIIGTTEQSKEASHHLLYAASFATNLRLKTYLYNKAQKETVSVFANSQSDKEKQVKEAFPLPKKELQENGGFFKFFYTAFSLYVSMQKFSESTREERKIIFIDSLFYDNNAMNKGFIYSKLMNYEKAAIEFQKSILQENEYSLSGQKSLNIQSRMMLARIYNEQGNQQQAILNYEGILYYKEYLNPFDLGHILNNLGNAYKSTAQYNKAIDCFKEALKLIPDESDTFNNFGEVYYAKEDYDLALFYYVDALKKNPNSPIKATILNNLCKFYTQKDQYKKASSYCHKALEIRLDFYGKHPHPDISKSLEQIGLLHSRQKEYDEALCYYNKALQILNILYGKSACSEEKAGLYINIANIYFSKTNYIEAVLHYNNADQILVNIEHHHKLREVTLKNIGGGYCVLGQYSLALKKYNEALIIMDKYFPNEKCKGRAEIYARIQEVYYKSKNIKLAKKYIEKSLNEIETFNCELKKNIEGTHISLDKLYMIHNEILDTFNTLKVETGKDFGIMLPIPDKLRIFDFKFLEYYTQSYLNTYIDHKFHIMLNSESIQILQSKYNAENYIVENGEFNTSNDHDIKGIGIHAEYSIYDLILTTECDIGNWEII